MPATLRILAERLEQPVPEGWEAELDAAVREGFRRELTPVPGIVQALEGIELPVCVASSGSHEKMRLTSWCYLQTIAVAVGHSLFLASASRAERNPD